MGATPIDFTKGSAPEQIAELTDGGTDKGIDAVGYQATVVLNDLIATRSGERQALQPGTARPDPGRTGTAQLRGVQTGPPGAGAGGLRALRLA